MYKQAWSIPQTKACKACWRKDPTAIGNRETKNSSSPACTAPAVLLLANTTSHRESRICCYTTTLSRAHSPVNTLQALLNSIGGVFKRSSLTTSARTLQPASTQHAFVSFSSSRSTFVGKRVVVQHLMHNSQQAKVWQTSSLGQYS
jgi:hypothetical protein